MTQAKQGDTVKVHYTGTLDDGSVFDSSEGDEPLEFTLGGGMLLPGFETAVEGLAEGGKATVTIPAEEAYGPYRNELLFSTQRSDFPDDVSEGKMYQLESDEGEATLITITVVEEDTVTFDANHPLAGQDLNFEITLVSIG